MDFSVVSLVNDDTLYSQFRRSLDASQGEGSLEFIPVHADSRGWNAATALNDGIENAHADWVILAHQDVLCPVSWKQRLSSAVAGLSPKVAIVGLVGIRPDGSFAGHVRDPHGHHRWLPLPSQVMSIDEHVIVLRKSSGVRFDPENPGFHCYGTDICHSARQIGFEAVVVDAPVVHLSGGRIDEKFQVAAMWLLRKWGRSVRYVIPTCARLNYRIRPGNLPLLLRIRNNWQASQLPGIADCDCDWTRVAE